MTLSNAYEKYPDHRIEIDDERVGLRVTANGQVLAETSKGLNLREGSYPAVVYVPRDDVQMDRLERSDHSTHCPFKGDASYYDCRASEGEEGGALLQVAWSYEDPFDQMASIRDHLAFYPERVTIESIPD